MHFTVHFYIMHRLVYQGTLSPYAYNILIRSHGTAACVRNQSPAPPKLAFQVPDSVPCILADPMLQPSTGRHFPPSSAIFLLHGNGKHIFYSRDLGIGCIFALYCYSYLPVLCVSISICIHFICRCNMPS